MSIEKLDLQSPDLVNENFEKLAALFPNCVTESAEGKAIDFDLLKQELNHAVVEGNKERYRLEWPGKREAIVTANLPTTKTLRPVREDSVDFDNTENLYIEGDNLEVLKLLQESYLGKIKMIYIDPPYNTGNDFVYKDNFRKDSKEELVEGGQIDEYNQRLVANPETAGRYHSDWLSMMYPRLKLARNLLTDDGVIFISIDDNEVHNLRKICDEIFGDVNILGCVAVVSNLKGRSDDKYFATSHNSLLVYQKENFTTRGIPIPEEYIQDYNEIDEQYGKYRLQGLRKRGAGAKRTDRPNMFYPFYVNPKTLKVSLELSSEYCIEVLPMLSDGTEGRWRWGKDTARLRIDELVSKEVGQEKRHDIFQKDFLIKDGISKTIIPKSIWLDPKFANEAGTLEVKSLFNNKPFDTPKPIGLIYDICFQSTDSNDIILDFFSGSATTAHAVLQLNADDGGKRNYIQVQIPELTIAGSEANKAGYKNICEIGKERIRRAAKKIKEETGADIDYGFRVYRLDESNMQDVYYKPQDYEQTNLDLFADNVKPDRTADDLLAQVMLDWGLPLSLKIEQIDVLGKQLFKVAENSLYACFDNDIDEDFAKAIAKDAPLRIVFKDSGFKNDTAKTNVKQLLKQLSPETEMKVF